MSVYFTKLHTVLGCFFLLVLVPAAEAFEAKGLLSRQTESEGSFNQRESGRSAPPNEGRVYRQSPQKQERYVAPPRDSGQWKQGREQRPARREYRHDRDRYQPPRYRPAERIPAPGDRPARRDNRYERDRYSSPRYRPAERSPKYDRRVRRELRNSHDRHYSRYSVKLRRPSHYRNHETYRYHTHYLAPIKHHYHRPGHRLRLLPRGYIRLSVLGLPYFYIGGVFYRHHLDGYIVVRAPIGAVVSVLPLGFVSFSIGGLSYYYVNDTYYLWDPDRVAYVVVEKPRGADRALASATEGRLFVYPNEGQSEEQQADDRYECHRWAVHETRVDPSLEEDVELTPDEQDNYRRAISACLEGRGYTVK